MLKESVRALKEELHSEVVKPFVERALESGVLGIRTRRLDFAATPHTVGLGITAINKAEDGFRLAVRVQHPGLRRSPLISHIKERARGEVDVRYIGHIRPFAAPWYQDTCRPMLIGSSIAHFRLTAGTLGAFVRDRVSGEICVLSNNHVLADENNGNLGDIILQPGVSDGGQIPGGMAATLTRFIPLQFPGPNVVDAAIATVDAAIGEDTATLNLFGLLQGLRTTPLAFGERVSKLGRSSGLTNGTIKTVELSHISLDYDQGTAVFVNQIEIEGVGSKPFSLAGDSGALIVDSNREALGLLCGGSDTGARTGGGLSYANPLGQVLDLLNVDLLF
jgi:hypothetical protein